jgi:hypothetical protein
MLSQESESRIATLLEFFFIRLFGGMGLGLVVVGFGAVNTGCGLGNN